MDKIISQKTYWISFFENNPDPEPFRAFIAADSVLIKIFNIVAVPYILLSIDTYPFDEKLSELSSISRDEIRYLHELTNKKGYEKNQKPVEYLDWLVAVYELVRMTLWYYQIHKNRGVLSGEELISEVVSAYREKFSIDEEYVFENNKGEKYTVHRIGRTLPDIWFQILELPGKIPIAQLHFLNKPTKEDIRYYENEFDVGSVVQFKKFRPHADEITFGNNSSNPDKHTVQFYHEGKKIGENFKYPIKSRYEQLTKKYSSRIDDKTEMLSEPLPFAEERLFRAALKYDPTTDVRPAGWFKANLKHLKQNYLEKISTTKLPGNPRHGEGAFPNCDPDCREQKKYENELPCEYETPEGYCGDPDQKRSMLRTAIENSGNVPEILTSEGGGLCYRSP